MEVVAIASTSVSSENRSEHRQRKEKMAMSILFAILLICLANGLTLMPPTTKTADHLPLAKLAMDYFDKSPDPFHAVQTSVDLLEKAGFEELDDVGAYKGKIQPGKQF